jgi:hypothetical protein
MMEDNQKDPMIKIGALWKGEKALTGSMGSARLVVLKNNYKTEDKHPDYIVWVTPQKKKEQQQDNGSPF